MPKEIIIHNIDIVTVQGNISGGTKCMVEIIKYLSKKYKNILYTCKSTEVGFIKKSNVINENIEYKPIGKYYFEKSYYSYVFNFFRSIFLSLSNIPRFDERNVNVIITHSELSPNLVYGLLMKLKNKNSIWMSFMHMPSPRLFRGYKGEYTNRKYFPNAGLLHFWLNQRIYNFLAKKADIVIATNFYYEGFLMEKFNKVGIIHYGIELPDGQTNANTPINLEHKEYDALFIGRFHEQKGIFELLDVWKKVIKINNKLKLAIAGSYLDQNNKKLVKQIKEMGLEGSIDLLGYKIGIEKENILRKSKIFLFPSLYESFGIVALEAMSFGLPVIAYNLPIFGIFERGMVKVPILDNDTFAKDFFKLLNNNLRYKEMSEEATEYSREFTWERTGEQFKDILDKLISTSY
ncbi:MAG: glycosyltransferase family 4 protein [Patescibacteria group bacterium]|jgi:glycosyltransferase involved in cell wall biosynthesis